MDQVTQNVKRGVEEYLNSLVEECLQAPAVVSFSLEQKQAFAQKVRDRLFDVTMEVMVDKMTEEQFSQIEHLDPTSPEMAEKIQYLSAQIPGFAQDLEIRLRQEVELLKQNPQT